MEENIRTAALLEMTEEQEKAYEEFIDYMVELYRKYGDGSDRDNKRGPVV